MSRIWDALRQAERQRNARGDDPTAAFRPDEYPSADSDRRKGLRHLHSVPLLVYGSGADKQPFHEETTTIDANQDGCLILMETVVVRGQRLYLANMRNQAEQECCVVHVGRRVRGKTRIGVEFIRPAPHFWRPA